MDLNPLICTLRSVRIVIPSEIGAQVSAQVMRP
jgi:hypothetical protein